MKTIIDIPARKGVVKAIDSKSMAHRLLIASFLSVMPCSVDITNGSADITATSKCIKALEERMHGMTDPVQLFCGESGSTLRFMLPIAGALGVTCDLVMEGRLPDRPVFPLDRELTSHGCRLSRPEHEVLRIEGKLKGGTYTLPGNVSSQYVTGLLFALPLADEDSCLIIEGQLQSRPYVDMTLDVLRRSGIEIDEKVKPGADDDNEKVNPETDRENEKRKPDADRENEKRKPETDQDNGYFADGSTCFRIPGKQKYKLEGNVDVEGDWSNAAFWLCLGAITGGPVTCCGLDTGSRQGDKAVIRILEDMGAHIAKSNGSGRCDLTVTSHGLKGVTIDASDIPDLVPILAATAAAASGKTEIVNAERLRLKESDRLKSVCTVLSQMGADISETENGLIIEGISYGGYGSSSEASLSAETGEITVDSFNDHRIAMMAAVAAAMCRQPVTIDRSEAVNKSYPGFFSDYESLGGQIRRD